MATLTVYPDADPEVSTVDGNVLRNLSNPGETYATIYGGVANFAQPGAAGQSTYFSRLLASTTTDQFNQLRRAFFLFDTSAIGGGTIDSATFSFIAISKSTGLGTTNLHLVSSNPASNTDLVVGDYDKLGSTSYGNVTLASIAADSITYNDISLNASGLAAINKTGITKFGTCDEWNLNSSFTGVWASGGTTEVLGMFADTDAAKKPKLTITYTEAPSSAGKNIGLLGIG